MLHRISASQKNWGVGCLIIIIAKKLCSSFVFHLDHSKGLTGLHTQRSCLRGRDDIHSNQNCDFIHARGCDCLGCSLNKNNLVFLLPVWLRNQSSSAVPTSGVSWRSQSFSLPSMCLTNPLWARCSSLPWRLWSPCGALGCSCSCIHPCSSPLFCQTLCVLPRAGPGCLSCVSKCWFLSPDLSLCARYTEHQFVFLHLGERKQTPVCFFPMSAGTCHCLFTCGDHFQPDPCHFLQLQRDYLQPQQPQHPHIHLSLHHGWAALPCFLPLPHPAICVSPHFLKLQNNAGPRRCLYHEKAARWGWDGMGEQFWKTFRKGPTWLGKM